MNDFLEHKQVNIKVNSRCFGHFRGKVNKLNVQILLLCFLESYSKTLKHPKHIHSINRLDLHTSIHLKNL